MHTIKAARNAMATRFEVVLHGENEMSLRAAAEEALDEIERLDRALSLYNPSSEIAQINAQAAENPVRVSPEIFRLLTSAKDLSALAQGAFDISIAPLIRCWGFMRSNGEMPSPEEIEEATQRCGMHLVELDSENCQVRFAREGVMLDLGAIGKGYAIDRAAELLREAGITQALIHGGTSSVMAIGKNEKADPWRIAIDAPPTVQTAEPRPPISIVDLEDQSLSVSASSGKYFEKHGKKFGHVLDPRTGSPVERNLLAAVILPSAMEADALSTALLVGGEEMLDRSANFRPEAKMLLAQSDPGKPQGFGVLSRGLVLLNTQAEEISPHPNPLPIRSGEGEYPP
jgi:thiamine biosynthesis lipoprotein